MQSCDLKHIAGIKNIHRCCRKSPHLRWNSSCIVFNNRTPRDIEGTISELYFVACRDESFSLNQFYAFLCITQTSYTTLWNSKIWYLLCKLQCKTMHCKSNLYEMFYFARIWSSLQFGVQSHTAIQQIYGFTENCDDMPLRYLALGPTSGPMSKTW